MASSSFVHLDVRSCFSLKEGAFTPEQLVAQAAALGMPAVALTDRDGSTALPGSCRRASAKVCGRSSARRSPCARTRGREGCAGGAAGQRRHGVREPLPALTDAHLLGERGDPWVAMEQICAHAAGLTVLLGPRSHPGRLAIAGRIDAAAKLAAGYARRSAVTGAWSRWSIGSSAFPRGDPLDAALRGTARREAVATNPVRYLLPEDAFVADALECMRRIVPIASSNVTRTTNAEGWLKPPPGCARCSAEHPELCDRTLELAEERGALDTVEADPLPRLPDAGGAKRRRAAR